MQLKTFLAFLHNKGRRAIIKHKLCGYTEGTLQLLHCMVAPVEVATEYPQGTLTATPTCSSHSGTALYESYVADQKNLDVYEKKYI